jgi:hypothetical protein
MATNATITNLVVTTGAGTTTPVSIFANSLGTSTNYITTGTPNGTLSAGNGAYATDILNGDLYIKKNGVSVNDWQRVLTASGTTSYTSGSILFANAAGNITQDNNVLFYDSTNNRVGFGTNTPGSFAGLSTVRLEFADDTGNNSDVLQRVAGGGWGAYQFAASQGTKAVPTIISNTGNFGEVAFSGYDGAAYQQGGFIRGSVDGTPGAGSMPGRITFWTTPSGSVTPVERMRISQNGIINMVGTTTFATTTAASSSANYLNVLNAFANNSQLTNATLTNATITNLFASSLIFSGVNVSSGTITNSTSTNLASLNATTTNFLSTFATIINSTSTKTFATTASSTNLFSTLATIGSAIFNSIFSIVGNFTTLNASTTNATTSNILTANITTLNGTTGNFLNLLASTTFASTTNFINALGTNSTVTNATSTNFFSTNSIVTNSTSTNSFATTFRATSATFTDATTTNLNVTGETTLGAMTTISDLATGGNITTAANIDSYTVFNLNQTTANQTITIPSPTNTTAGKIVYINNVGSVEFIMNGDRVRTGSGRQFIWNGTAWSGIGDAGGQTTFAAVKSSNQALTASSIALQNVTEFSFPIAANEVWIFELAYNYTTGGSATPDIRWGVNNSGAGAICNYNVVDATSLAAAGSVFSLTGCNSATGVIVPSNLTTGQKGGVLSGMVSATGAGTIQFRAAQGVSNAAITTILASSTLQAYRVRGADLAEVYYTQDSSINYGDLVSLDGTGVSQISKSNGLNDRNMLGIVSTKPGLVMGEADGNGKPVIVALTGRVPVKVTNTNGDIKAGDFITSSNIPGVAMKATEAGQVIGQALSDYTATSTDAVGTVMVFIKKHFEAPIVLLFDDIFAELDQQHTEHIIDIFDVDQVVVTTQRSLPASEKWEDFSCIKLNLQ